MCGRFTLVAAPEVVAEMFHLVELPEFSPRYNIAPTQDIATVVGEVEPGAGGGAIRHVYRSMRWGLVPSWADDLSIGSRLINARAETLAAKPSFRSAFKRRRCLVMADGFYEWKKLEGRKQPFHIRLRNGKPFAFAGLWEQWQGTEGSLVDSCTIITTEPNELLASIHDRMPVILPPKDHDRWLDPATLETADVSPLLQSFPAEELEAFPVGLLVNSPTHDDPKCIERISARPGKRSTIQGRL